MKHPFLLPIIFFAASCLAHAAPQQIAKEVTWVSPLWGYNTPKIVYNGKAWYAAGMRGTDTKSGEAVINTRNADGTWRERAHFPGAYQPPTLGVDGTCRLIVAHTRINLPVHLARAKSPKDEAPFEDLPAPPQMTNAYYIGMAVQGAELWLAWIDSPENTMRLARLDLEKAQWSDPVAVQAGQVAQKPKTAWVYPVLIPALDGGLHFAASNSPDGGEGNTYNEVWYLHYPKGSLAPDMRERIAVTRPGIATFCTDLAEDRQGVVHATYMFNVYAYGEPLAADAEPAGLWHAWRDSAKSAWNCSRVGEPGISGFSTTGGVLQLYLAGNGAILRREWNSEAKTWSDQIPVVSSGMIPNGPGFMDTVSSGSGSSAPGPAIITDCIVEENGVKRNVTWAVFPD